jgi:anti-anti-sigma factor
MSNLQFTAAETAGEVRVSGDLNRNSVPEAWSQRDSWLPADSDVVLDLAGVEHVDSAGLALLIRLKSELDAANQSLSLRNVNKQLQQFAAVSGVTDLLSLS